MAALLVIAALTGLALAAISSRVLGRRRLIGDEAYYLQCAAAEDHYAPRPFLRVPLLSWLAARCHQQHDASGQRLRRLLAAASILTVALTVPAGWYLGGLPVAATATVLLLLQPERLVLEWHIWPDALVGLVTTALTLLLVIPTEPTPGRMLILGLLCAAGCLTRIDFVVVPPVVLASLYSLDQNPGALGLFLLLTPTAVGLTIWSLRNRRRYGLFLPDDTWTFNLVVSESESHRSAADFKLEPLLDEHFPDWSAMSQTNRVQSGLGSLMGLARRPLPFFRGILRRGLALLGPDTFIREKLLAPDGAYPEIPAGWRRALDWPLRLAFPILATLSVLGVLLGQAPPPAYAWPALSLLAIATVFFARTRFRLAPMPVIALLAAQGAVAVAEALADAVAASAPPSGVLLAGPLLLLLLTSVRCAGELPSVPKGD